MKPKILSIVLFFCGFGLSAFAQPKQTDPARKVISLQQRVTSLAVLDDIRVILLEKNSNEIVIEGDAKDVEKLKIKIHDGELAVSGLQPNPTASIKVYVPAVFLNRVILNSNSELTSASILSNPFLRVLVAGEGKVQLRSTGKLIVEGVDGFDFIKTR